MQLPPQAFMSYTRFDDEHNAGYLSDLRERLSNEVRGQSGEKFTIFQDTKDIKLGQQFEQRITETLQSVIFFIPILTPSFFKSEYCCEELRQFLEREKHLQRHDLILPIYYIESALLEDPAQRTNDGLAQIIAKRQRIDWRAFRFEALDAPSVRRQLAVMAKRIDRVMQELQASEAFRMWQGGGGMGQGGAQPPVSGTPAPLPVTASPSPATQAKLTPGKRSRLEQERTTLQAEWQQRHQKQERLRKALAIETDAAVRFKLEHQIGDEERQLAQLDSKIEAIDQALQ